MKLTGCERISLEARFLAKLKYEADGCRVWTGALSRGGNRPGSSPYGSIKVTKRHNSVRVHVVSAFLKGIIPSLRVPPGMHLDHCCQCHGTMCVDCLELVPAAINLQRVTERPLPKTRVVYRQKTSKAPVTA